MNHDNTLKHALAANAAFSGITGLGALTLAAGLAESLGPPAWSLQALGAGLLIFAALVAAEARGPRRATARLIVAADLAWVVTAGILIAVAPSWLTGTGHVTLATVSFVVAAAAAAQWRGLRVSSAT